MDTEDNEYFSDILDTLNKYQDRHGELMSIKKLKKMFIASWIRKKKKLNVT